jgi:hypothetical protein
MNTVILKNTANESTRGKSFSIQVVGDSPVKLAVLQSIKELQQHPAPSAARSLIDMLGLIEKHNFQIRYTEHDDPENGLETWLFALQG